MHDRGRVDLRRRRARAPSSRSASATIWSPTIRDAARLRQRACAPSTASLRAAADRPARPGGGTSRRRRRADRRATSAAALRDRAASTAATCVSVSIIRTPGISGAPGKWPWKKSSLTVTFLCATSRVPARARRWRRRATTDSDSRGGRGVRECRWHGGTKNIRQSAEPGAKSRDAAWCPAHACQTAEARYGFAGAGAAGFACRRRRCGRRGRRRRAWRRWRGRRGSRWPARRLRSRGILPESNRLITSPVMSSDGST